MNFLKVVVAKRNNSAERANRLQEEVTDGRKVNHEEVFEPAGVSFNSTTDPVSGRMKDIRVMRESFGAILALCT